MTVDAYPLKSYSYGSEFSDQKLKGIRRIHRLPTTRASLATCASYGVTCDTRDESILDLLGGPRILQKRFTSRKVQRRCLLQGGVSAFFVDLDLQVEVSRAIGLVDHALNVKSGIGV